VDVDVYMLDMLIGLMLMGFMLCRVVDSLDATPESSTKDDVETFADDNEEWIRVFKAVRIS